MAVTAVDGGYARTIRVANECTQKQSANQNKQITCSIDSGSVERLVQSHFHVDTRKVHDKWHAQAVCIWIEVASKSNYHIFGMGTRVNEPFTKTINNITQERNRVR